MLLTILLLNLVLPSLALICQVDAKSTPKQSLEDLENLVEKLLDSRLGEMEIKMEDEKAKEAKEKKELEAKNQEMETRLEELEDRLKEEKNEMEKTVRGLEASISKLRIEVGESLRKEIASNSSNSNALTNPSLRDLPIVIISAWQEGPLKSPQTVTFESFLANFNNAARPGGGDGVLDLDSGVFTCFTPGYYHVSFSAHSDVGVGLASSQFLYLYKNGIQLPESYWNLYGPSLSDTVGATGSRIVVSNFLKKVSKCKITIFPDSSHGCGRHSGAENDEG